MIEYTYTDEDKKEIIKNIPFHIERTIDVETEDNKSSFLFKDELLQENPLEEIIEIVLAKTPVNCSDNYNEGIIRDPGKKDVPSMFQTSEFWQTFFKHAMGSLYNELILYSFNRLKYPFVNEISLLYDSIFYGYEDKEKEISFENTFENEEISDLKLNSISDYLDYKTPQVELIDYWITHLIASGSLKESEEETETVLYRAQDLRNELLRRKVAGSLIGYQSLLNSVNLTGSLYPALPVTADENSLDPRLTRGINLPGITTIIPTLSVDPRTVFPEVPSKILNPAYYTSSNYVQENFLSNPTEFLRFKNSDVYWDHLSGIVDISLVKISYSRLDKDILDALDEDPILLLDDETPIFNFSVSSEAFLDIQANKIYNINNTLQVKKRELYPYYIDTVAQSFGPSLSDIPWLSYVEKFIDEKKRVSEEVKIGMQVSLIDKSIETNIVIRELGCSFKAEIDSVTEDYVYDSAIHDYMFIYSVEIQYHRSLFTVREGYPKKTLMTIVYLKQPSVSGDTSNFPDSYLTFISNSSGIIPFKIKNVRPENLPSYILKIDKNDLDEPIKDYVEEAGYSKAFFYFISNEHSRLLNKDTITPVSEFASIIGDTFSNYPPIQNSFYFIYGYEHENDLAYWSDMLTMTRLDLLMNINVMKPDWYENIFYMNPQLNFNPPGCTYIENEGERLQSLSRVHKYEVYNNDIDASTAAMTTASLPQGFFLQKYRTILPAEDLINETFRIWGDNRYVREEYTLVITGAPSADENISIVLDGATAVDIAVLSTDAIGDVTDKIILGSFGDWTAIKSDVDTVIFTAATREETTGTYSVTAGTTTSTFTKTTDLGDPLDDPVEGIYRNIIQTDSYGIDNIFFEAGDAYIRGNTIDTYYDIVQSTIVSAESDRPLWYWNRTESYEGMTFFTKIMFSDGGLSKSGAVADLPTADNQYIISRSGGSGTTANPSDEFEFYYDQPNSKFVFKVYPTGYSVSGAATGFLGELVLSTELDWTMDTALPVRAGASYSFEDIPNEALKRKVTLVIVVDGEYSEQVYTIEHVSGLDTGDISIGTLVAHYTVYDENALTFLQVNASSDIVLDDSVFNYNERYSVGSWEHFLGMLHKDGGQTNYAATGINLFTQNHMYPFMGKVYDIRLHTCGFSLGEMILYNKGTRREILTGNIDSFKVYNHFAGDFALGMRVEDVSSNIINSIRAFDRSKWHSILVDPHVISLEETVAIHDRYYPNYANDLLDRDTYVYEGVGEEDLINPDAADYDDAQGVIKSFLKNNLEVISGFSWDNTYKLYYENNPVDTIDKSFDLIQTSLYPITYDDYSIITNPDLIVDADGTLKAYVDATSTNKPTGSSSAININTTPSGDTLVYKCDMIPYFNMNAESFSARSLFKGNRLQHYLDTKLNEVSLEISDSKEPEATLSRLLVMPLIIPSQDNVDNSNLNALSLKGLKFTGELQKLLNPASYYQEFIYPYSTGYRVDVVRSIKEGVYFIPVRFPILIEANYNNEKKKLFKNIETLIKVEVVGTIVDNSSGITEATVESYREINDDTEVEMISVDPDSYGEFFYRKITIKAYYYKNTEGVWAWEQILSNESGADVSLTYDTSEPMASLGVEFVLSNKVDVDEFLSWDAVNNTFIDKSGEPADRIMIYDEFKTKPTDTLYLTENSSYLMYFNLKSVTSNIRYSSDVSCSPNDSKLFENPNTNDIINILNTRLNTLGIGSSSINYGYSITTNVYDAVDTGNGIYGNPYANDQSNYILNDLDYRFIDSNVYTMKYVSLFASPDDLKSFPIGFLIDPNNNNSNTTILYDDNGDLVEYNINEKEALSGHYYAHTLKKKVPEVIGGFYSFTPVIDNSPVSPVYNVNIDSEAELYSYQLSLDSRNIPRWINSSVSYDEFKLYKNVFYEKIEDLGESYSSGYYLEYDYTAPGSYTITFSEKDIYKKAYIQISLTIGASITGVVGTPISVIAATPTWIVADVIDGVVTLTSDTTTVMSILNIKPYQVNTATTNNYKFLSEQDNRGEDISTIRENRTFVYLSEDPDARKWFIQFKSTYSADTNSSDPALTAYSGYLNDFLSINYNKLNNTVSNPWIHTVVYKEDGDEITVYIKGELVDNSANSLIYVETMAYNAPENVIDIGSDTSRGISLNNASLSNINLLVGAYVGGTLTDDIIITNERMSSTTNCIDPIKIQNKESSVNAITNVQLMADNEIVYEFEFPPLIYDELTHHISFNILLSR